MLFCVVFFFQSPWSSVAFWSFRDTKQDFITQPHIFPLAQKLNNLPANLWKLSTLKACSSMVSCKEKQKKDPNVLTPRECFWYNLVVVHPI